MLQIWFPLSALNFNLGKDLSAFIEKFLTLCYLQAIYTWLRQRSRGIQAPSFKTWHDDLRDLPSRSAQSICTTMMVEVRLYFTLLVQGRVTPDFPTSVQVPSSSIKIWRQCSHVYPKNPPRVKWPCMCEDVWDDTIEPKWFWNLCFAICELTYF